MTDLPTTREATIAAMLETDTTIADILSQLEQHPKNNDWKKRAKAALRYARIDRQELQLHLGVLSKQAKFEGAQRYERVFIEVAQELLAKEMMQTLRDETHRRTQC